MFFHHQTQAIRIWQFLCFSDKRTKNVLWEEVHKVTCVLDVPRNIEAYVLENVPSILLFDLYPWSSSIFFKTEDMNDPNPTKTFRFWQRMGRFSSVHLRFLYLSNNPMLLSRSFIFWWNFFDIKKEPTRHLTFVSGPLSSDFCLSAYLMHVCFQWGKIHVDNNDQ